MTLSDVDNSKMMDQPVPISADEVTGVKGTTPKKKKKKSAGRVILKIVIWLLVIAGVILLTLFLAAKISQLGTIPAVIDYIIENVRAL